MRFRGVKVLVDLEGLEMARLANFRGKQHSIFYRTKLNYLMVVKLRNVHSILVISLGITLSKRYMDIADEILDELVFINGNT